ncbi:MAG: hypothetical protein RIC35_04805 [Marinoscillum sp.]
METPTKVYNIYHDSLENLVVMEWHGYATSSEFKEGTELMLNTLIQNNCKKVLADIKEMVLIGMEDQRWLTTLFIPRAAIFGFKALAMVRSDNYFNQVAVESVCMHHTDPNLRIEFFDTNVEARAWLQSID